MDQIILLNQKIFNYCVDLDTFSRVTPNTDIHLSKTGFFVPTGGKLSSIAGVQTIYNIYYGYTPKQLCIDLTNFANRLISTLMQLYKLTKDYEEYKLDTLCKIKFVYKEYKLAYGDIYHGLCCLVITYQNTDYHQDFINCVVFLRTQLKELKNKVKSWVVLPHKLTYCPEEHFKDDDWKLFLKNSQYLQYETTSMYKFYVLYNSSLFYNYMMNWAKWNWYDQIYTCDNDTHITLGGMPMKASVLGIETRNDLKELYHLNIKAVLCLEESFENNSNGMIYSPIKPYEWDFYDIHFLQVPIADFCDMKIEKIQTCVAYIEWCVKNHYHIYINCRVGRNRSVAILAGFFIKYLNMSVDDAYNLIKSKRPQIQKGHYKTLQLYYDLLNKK